MKLNASSGVLLEYLWGVLSHSGKRKRIQSLAGGAAGSMPNISKANLNTVEIPVPPEKLQMQFKAILLKRYQVSKLNHRRDMKVDTLFNSLSQKAFSGEL
ncbi:hypothetical protein ACH42_01615 [Endozoicomonas sp. (ex Bugula neritina AB1)]|nr:hypothetical protein ACH42_01615 [Endozoicomonas sp. (ex Bugula neritina AB1)]